jgi:hypothetical protein
MERVPNTPHALIHTRHRLARLSVLLARVIPQELGLLPHTVELHVLHAQRPCGSVHVVCGDDGVSPGPWADCDFDLRAVLRERGQRRLYEGVHASRRAPPVAVVEAE